MKQIFVLATICILMCSNLSAQIVGKWKTIDDETNKPKSIVEFKIVKDKNGNEELRGKILKLFKEPNEDQDPKCTKCTDTRKNQKIIGMEIVTGLKRDGASWAGDNGILDPNNGKIYNCKLWVDEKNPNVLHVRGYIGFFYRTQTWYREK